MFAPVVRHGRWDPRQKSNSPWCGLQYAANIARPEIHWTRLARQFKNRTPRGEICDSVALSLIWVPSHIPREELEIDATLQLQYSLRAAFPAKYDTCCQRRPRPPFHGCHQHTPNVARFLLFFRRTRLSLDNRTEIEDRQIGEWQLHHLDHLSQEQIPAQHVAGKETSSGRHDAPGSTGIAGTRVIDAGCSETERGCSTHEKEHEDEVGAERAQQEDEGE